MTPEQKAAFVQARTARMLAEMAAMWAENQMAGRFPPHAPRDFRHLPVKYGVVDAAIRAVFLGVTPDEVKP